MFRTTLSKTLKQAQPHMTRGYKVVVVGGAGGIGQPMSLLMTNNSLVTEMAVYDVVGAPGVAADLSHCDAKAKVTGHGPDDIANAFKGADLVLVPAGVPRKPGMTRQDLFDTNANINKTLAEAFAEHCPDAVAGIISNPVNSTVPIWCETLKKAGKLNAKKIYGVCTLDHVRARKFLGDHAGINPKDVSVAVIGGHAGASILPILSGVTPKMTFTDDERDALVDRIQNGGTEVVKAKDGAGSATLSMALAGAEFGDAILRAMDGEKGIYMASYVQQEIAGASYFATEVEFGPNGEYVNNKGLPEMDAYEKAGLEKAVTELNPSIEEGNAFCA
eukprot:g3435.t1